MVENEFDDSSASPIDQRRMPQKLSTEQADEPDWVVVGGLYLGGIEVPTEFWNSSGLPVALHHDHVAETVAVLHFEEGLKDLALVEASSTVPLRDSHWIEPKLFSNVERNAGLVRPGVYEKVSPDLRWNGTSELAKTLCKGRRDRP